MDTSSTQDLDTLPAGHRSGFVAIVGRPNVGKSTLVNQFLGQKIAIVSAKPQTTRTRLLGILTRPEAQVIFVDTPGLHQPFHKLGEVMVASATAAIPDADVILLVVDVAAMPSEDDREAAQAILQASHKPVVLALNKMDRLPIERVQAHVDAYLALVPDLAGWIMTIATDGVNLDKLLELIIGLLPEGPRYYPDDQVTDQLEREIAGELIREQVLHLTRSEVPHAVAVVVEEYKERENGAVYIAANIYVEKDSQKGIIIGAGGQMLRRIGEAARQEIEQATGRRIFLDLWVKVSKNWRQNPARVRQMGYTE